MAQIGAKTAVFDKQRREEAQEVAANRADLKRRAEKLCKS